jgi:hypothetical protein
MFSTEDIFCMYMRLLTLVVLVFSMAAFAQSAGDTPVVTPNNYGYVGDWFQVKYFPNLGIPSGAYINISNTGRQGGKGTGDLCINVYGFDPNEEMFACCNCKVTPNGLVSLNVYTDLVGKALTPNAPTAAVVKLMATTTAKCDAGNAYVANDLARGMVAWGTSLHALPTSPVTYGITETAFSKADLGATELANLTLYCRVIGVIGSGYGTCNSCKAGGLGAAGK